MIKGVSISILATAAILVSAIAGSERPQAQTSSASDSFLLVNSGVKALVNTGNAFMVQWGHPI
jgi:hypothetical protein